ncbi:prolyl oligopeptidase family serine peptidase [Xanthomonas maliensis]|uniref:S9 family peptidase n=1 Tax=Xanthomonas maliensis TaxID=1321368 RepID=UPI0003B48019
MGVAAVLLPLWAIAANPEVAAEGAGYRLPSPALQAVVDAPRAPLLRLSPRRDLAAVVQLPALPDIAEVAQPELKLAGLRLHPGTHAASRFSFASTLSLLTVTDGSERQLAGLPTPLSLADLAWSPDQRYVAFRREDAASGANELWLVDVATGQARRLLSGLNTVVDDALQWLPDSSGLLLQQQLPGQAPAPATVPQGPAIQQTAVGAGVRAIRTYQDLLRNESDAQLFEHYASAQPVLLDLAGQVRRLGSPGIYLRLSLSPDGRYVLSERIERPFSYLVPAEAFPRRVQVLDLQGKLVREIARLPLVEGLPTGNDAVPTGVREIDWRQDAPATLVWAEAQDGGDPAREVAVRDVVRIQAAPFTRAPVTLARLASRYQGVLWGRGDLAIVTEAWWKTRRTKQWRIAPEHPERAAELLWDRSSQDRYSDPGTPALWTDERGHQRLHIGSDGNSLFLLGKGASPEGDRPFVDRFDLRSKQATRLFHSQAPTYSAPIALLDAQASQILLSRESPEEPANYLVQTVGQSATAPRALTHITHPLPQLRGVRKEQIRYKRADGLDLTATLLLPPGYDPKRDGPRPLLMWAYPGEFKSADAAGQVTDSPYRFNAISFWGPQAFLALGYVVLNNPSMPIVGEGVAEPNDTYLPQLIADAQAAVDEVVRRGVTDREHIAIGGHSYGAFMTANLLAHTRLFKAGIARSGAYNRSLTPFGFQAEERNYWQAQAVYQAMAPFNYADKIKDPLLLIHGQDDNNSGTFPIQSERLFAAIKGLGGTARLVMLPNEAHAYRARQSVMQMLAESEQWLQTYLGTPPPPADTPAS